MKEKTKYNTHFYLHKLKLGEGDNAKQVFSTIEVHNFLLQNHKNKLNVNQHMFISFNTCISAFRYVTNIVPMKITVLESKIQFYLYLDT